MLCQLSYASKITVISMLQALLAHEPLRKIHCSHLENITQAVLVCRR